MNDNSAPKLNFTQEMHKLKTINAHENDSKDGPPLLNKSNWATVRIWLPKKTTDIGHVSLQTEKTYASFWPSETKDFIKHPFGVKSELYDLSTDIKDEGRESEHAITFYSLDVGAIDNAFEEAKKQIVLKDTRWSILGSSALAKDTQNCVGFVARLLLAGNIKSLISPYLLINSLPDKKRLKRMDPEVPVLFGLTYFFMVLVIFSAPRKRAIAMFKESLPSFIRTAPPNYFFCLMAMRYLQFSDTVLTPTALLALLLQAKKNENSLFNLQDEIKRDERPEKRKVCVII